MRNRLAAPEKRLFLGIECGATHTTALLADTAGSVVGRATEGPANVQLLDDKQLRRLLRSIAGQLKKPDSIAIGMAGARSEEDFERVRRAAAKVWPGVATYATNDLETALAAAPRRAEAKARVLVLSGTGSCCFGQTSAGSYNSPLQGKATKVGGWGHILGDKGSGYEIGLRGLKAVVYYYDRDGKWPALGTRLLRALQLNEPNDLIGWVQHAEKAEVAALAKEVFDAWHESDRIAADIIDGAVASLSKDAVACAKRLGVSGTAQFVLAGSVLLKQPRFARRVAKEIEKCQRRAMVTPLTRESVWGAVELARSKAGFFSIAPAMKRQKAVNRAALPEDIRTLVSSPTEQRNPRSMALHTMSLSEAIKLMLDEERNVPAAILKESANIERVIRLIVQTFRRGGRLFYVGAGTSGRLGVLDASECPPTFRAPTDLVQGIIAGGQHALWEAVEGAEDDPAAGARAIQFRGITRRDVVVGIAASGRTPFVWGALAAAKRLGARTVLLTFNPTVHIRAGQQPSVVVAPNVGPEILTGSTRLKSGTATKLILNIFTTLAMVRTGKVLSNLMIDVKASNLKLRDRATRIVQQLTGIDYELAREALERTDWQIKRACSILKAKIRK
jgi:N-acetylmuramic acid 6-phosphate etherase